MAEADHTDGRSARPRLHRGDTMMTVKRVAAAKYDLELIKRDVCLWLSETLQLDVTPDNFMDTLDTGVVVCKLVQLIQEKARSLKEAGEEVSSKIPLNPIKYHGNAKKATFQARENTKHFLDWCRGLGVRDDFVFESNGLVEHADEKRVLLCLLEVSRYARKLHIKPPNIISMEPQEPVLENNADRQVETVKPEDDDEAVSSENIAASFVDQSQSSETNLLNEPSSSDDKEVAGEASDLEDLSKLTEIKESYQPSETNLLNEPPSSDDQKAGVSAAAAEDKAITDDDSEVASSSFLDRCSYPFLFSLLLLLLLLGGGFYLRRRK